MTVKKIIVLSQFLLLFSIANAQSNVELEQRISVLEQKLEKLEKSNKNFSAKFGSGLQLVANDSSFYMRTAFSFQSLFANEWSVRNDQWKYIENHQPNFLIRRARLKFDGWAFTQKLKYKLQLGFSNKDISGGNSNEYSNASRIVLDAYLDWNFWNNFSVLVGQTKLTGNRESSVSGDNLQFVDRSLLHSKFSLDRDMGIQLTHHTKIGKQFILKETFGFTQGEGRNITSGHFNGFSYTFKVEALPLGAFASDGEYIGGDINREQRPKLAIAVAYNFNNNAVKEAGQLGRFIKNSEGKYVGKDLHQVFADVMFKYKGFSLLGEYSYRTTQDGIPNLYDPLDLTSEIGTFYTGQAFNIQAGYLFKKNYELAGRFTMVLPQHNSVNHNQFEYTLGTSKYFMGHKLKIQTDVAYRSIAQANDILFWRLHTVIHF